jgi:hypothetical protein
VAAAADAVGSAAATAVEEDAVATVVAAVAEEGMAVVARRAPDIDAQMQQLQLAVRCIRTVLHPQTLPPHPL